ncbi:ferrous iron transport protein A [Desulfobotulus sp. H1]|uniref:Ferrous iron transport protein A n=1 Tax=Desulfobotulus pelophilus TaxID=2823377 RepID=A0ABT3NBK7_9BACT|nr:ferrous iron transport protein A [Desulfobotulus pelophilus]MCW7754853.1 ferrous iron transport protein A [Desulfobotulus pelophilus]
MLYRLRRKHRKNGNTCQCEPETAHTACPLDCQVLTQVGKGCRCRIRGHKSCGAVRQRLLDLGFVPNMEVEVVRCATLGDPLEMRVGDYYVTLRKREAALIEVQDL